MKTVSVEISNEILPYLEQEATIRRVSLTKLVRLLIDTIGRDQCVLAVLDDGGLPIVPSVGERRRNVPSVERPAAPPRSRQELAFNPQNFGPSTRRRPQTRSEMEADLRQALLNSGGRLA